MKQLTLIVVFAILTASLSFAQENNTRTKKPSQALMQNDFQGGYGGLSIFYFTGRMAHKDAFPTEQSGTYTEPKSAGTFFLAYARQINSVVSTGLLFGVQNFAYTGEQSHPQSTVSANDLLLSGIGRVTFSYVNRPAVRIYSGIGIGVTLDFGRATVYGGKEFTERKIWPAGQLTFMGVRFGREFGGFLEFGMGSYGVINAGLSYRFADESE